ncbi:Uma2 family endonuclease [Azospirillum endophyticum]
MLRVTSAAFLAMTFDDDVRYELVDGEIVAQAPPLPVYSSLLHAFACCVGDALAHRRIRTGKPYHALTKAAVRVPFDADHNSRLADLAVTCEPFDPESPYTTAPVLLAEILSPTEEKAQRAKLHAYAAMPSVREILFLDSRAIRAELHRRDADNFLPAAPEVLEEEGRLVLETAGLDMPLAELYRDLGF